MATEIYSIVTKRLTSQKQPALWSLVDRRSTDLRRPLADAQRPGTWQLTKIPAVRGAFYKYTKLPL